MTFREKLSKSTVLIDGAFGTYIQALGLSDEELGKASGCMEAISLTRPDLVARVHADYLEAGADAVETNSFGGTRIKLSEYALGDKVFEMNRESARIASETARKFSTPSRKRYVIGAMGPTGKLPSSMDPSLGNISYAELKEVFYDQAMGLIAGEVDAILVETGQDILEMKAAVNGAREAARASSRDIVLMGQVTLSNSGRMLLGTKISAAMSALAYVGADVIGANCGMGPLEMEGAMKFLSENSPVGISCVPNAGLPVDVNGKAFYDMKPEEMGDIMARLLREYRIDVIGGCCGTDPRHISLMRRNMRDVEKRRVIFLPFMASGYDAFNISAAEKPVKVGERINTQGSKNAKEMFLAENFDAVVELGKDQIKKGARILDVCTVLTERKTEKRDTINIVRRLAEAVEAPVMIDSTDPLVIEAAAAVYPGNAVINSVNFEDGGRKAARIFSAAKEHGSFVVCLAIDEKGMARTVPHKMDIAAELIKLGVGKHGLLPHQLMFDMLTFSLGTGEKEYAGSAVDTFEAIKKIKESYPGVLTVLGVSNVSFGLPKPGRKVLNAVYLYHAVHSGLDLALVNPGEFMKYPDVQPHEAALCEDLLFNRRDDALERFVEHFSHKAEDKKNRETPKEALSVEDRVKRCVIERDRSDIVPALDEALKKYNPEDIINNVLLDAMRTVGEKFESGEFVLPYVLQAAEVMRKGSEHLEKFMDKARGRTFGKVVLATVLGDVHDIGKNLVKMILKNNGFEVIDLGKQVSASEIVAAAKTHKADAVGLSALLVSTARYMQECVKALSLAGVSCPVMIGGAPTSDGFAREISVTGEGEVYPGGVFRAKDAFDGLKIMSALMDPAGKKALVEKISSMNVGAKPSPTAGGNGGLPARTERRSGKAPVPPFYGVKTVLNIPFDEALAHMDKNILFKVSWGAGLKDRNKKDDLLRNEYEQVYSEIVKESARGGWLDLKAVYGYFMCSAEGDALSVFGDNGGTLETLELGRSGGRSLADYFLPGRDLVAFQAVTVGDRLGKVISGLDKGNEYSKVLYLHGFGVNLAEAAASYMHERIRKELGLRPGQGKRYSPGYPLWRDLSDQRKIFHLLEIEKRIGLTLTEACQIVPEQSTTAMVIYNELAEY
jgi:5-methyltetrahydrofolate--homocysteine methyltransferase